MFSALGPDPRVRMLIAESRASQARSPYAAYASTPIGGGMAVSSWSEARCQRTH
jgi:hypothetical protein